MRSFGHSVVLGALSAALFACASNCSSSAHSRPDGAAGSTSAGGTAGTGQGGSGGVLSDAGGLDSRQEPGAMVSFLGDPAYPDDFWQTATPEESHVDAAGIAAALKQIAGSHNEIHSFLVARKGRLVFEYYGWKTGKNADDPDKSQHQVVPSERHLVHSTTKSVTSSLIAIAIGEGLLPGVSDRVVPYFPEYQPLPAPSTDKDAITIEDLLTMRSGLQYSEGADDNPVFFDTADPAKVMLSRAVVTTPGTVWNYSSGGCDILTALLRKVTGKIPAAYAAEKLFGPLGVSNVGWQAAGNGTNYGGWGLSLTPRDMARFGELYRNRGAWKGNQVVPTSWADIATSSHCSTPWNGDYGYLFWIPKIAGFFGTRGAYGQNIYVNRTLELVVVFTSDLPVESADMTLDKLLSAQVVPAIK
jgi:CubicO group peptidase (beta-lactamase class C family)